MATASAEGPLYLPLVTQPGQRSSSLSLDALPTNLYVEKQPDGRTLMGKRPGFSLQTSAAAVGTARGRGIYNWQGVFYTVIGGTLYTIAGGAPAALGAVHLDGANPSKLYWFNETLGAVPYLYLSDGTGGYTVNGGVLAAIADPDFPAATVPGSAFLDGTLYVMDVQGRIWGSALNDPTNWVATNVVQAQVEPDKGVAIAKQSIYVIALKQWTTEVFYDAGSYAGTLTGSVLLPAQNAKQPWGCFAPYSVQSINDELFWVGGNKSSTSPVVLHMAGLKIERISTPPIERLLEANPYPTIFSFQFRQSGHTYYALNYSTNADGLVSTFSFCLVYDLEQREWYNFTSGQGNAPYLTYSAGAVTAGGSTTPTLLQGLWGGRFYTPSPTAYTDQHIFLTNADADAVDSIQADIVTPNYDGGTRLKKTLTKLRILADQYSAGTLLIRWSDDDYKTWSNWKQVNLQLIDPFLTNLGTFKKRAFHFRHQMPAAYRIEAVEMERMLGAL